MVIVVPTYTVDGEKEEMVGAATLTPNTKYVLVARLPTVVPAVTVLLAIKVLVTDPPKLVYDPANVVENPIPSLLPMLALANEMVAAESDPVFTIDQYSDELKLAKPEPAEPPALATIASAVITGDVPVGLLTFKGR